MTDRPEPPGAGGVGSVGEEAAKLFGALQDWARTTTAGGATGAPGDTDGSAGGSAGWDAAFRHVDEHLATGDASCTLCPVCQVITRLRGTSPEVRQHLAVAARSLLEAAAGLLETRVPPESRRSGGQWGGVQRIDLDEPAPTEDRSAD
ncbi:MAG: hypothetical protein QOK15_3698 [Nocardioidaceae bacterium]|jgi:hypothetical protein|nr:hypothetical protein [Nocardioidaceae bacterium]